MEVSGLAPNAYTPNPSVGERLVAAKPKESEGNATRETRQEAEARAKAAREALRPPHPRRAERRHPRHVLARKSPSTAASVGLPRAITDGRLLALNSYENRVYQVGQEEGPPVVAKFYRPAAGPTPPSWRNTPSPGNWRRGKSRWCRPWFWPAPPCMSTRGFRFAVYPRRGGRMPRVRPRRHPGMDGPLHRPHPCRGRPEPFANRPTLDIASFGEEPRDFLLAGRWLPADLLPAWKSVIDQALELAGMLRRAGDFAILRLHGDCHAGNVLWTDAGPTSSISTTAAWGRRCRTCGCCCPATASSQIRQLADVLAGYEDFREFDPRELHLVEALRTLRLIHHAAWLARRWDDPAFPAAFPWFNTQHYWQDRILELREQIALMMFRRNPCGRVDRRQGEGTKLQLGGHVRHRR
jgi:hypothetical protein